MPLEAREYKNMTVEAMEYQYMPWKQGNIKICF